MSYKNKIIYPKEEVAENNKMTERTFNEYIEDLEIEELVNQYNQLLASGYSVAVNYLPPKLDTKGKEVDVFAIAKRLERAGISYKATLKLKAGGDYESMLKIGKMFEQEDYDYDISLTLQVRENSTIDFSKESTWFDKDYAKFKINPKASSGDILELKTLFDRLKKEKQEVSITLKTKAKKNDEDSFASELATYPQDTEVIFKLTNAEI